MAPKAAPDQSIKATDAYTRLVAAGHHPTVRALAKEAGIATEAARQWLATHRPQPATTPMPDEVAAAIRTAAEATVWPTALSAARDEIADDQAAEVAALRESEAQAVVHVDELTDRIETLVGELETVRGEFSAQVREAQQEADNARTALAEAEGRIAAAETDAQTARAELAAQVELTAAAEYARTRAEATAETLEKVLRGFQDDARAASATGDADNEEGPHPEG